MESYMPTSSTNIVTEHSLSSLNGNLDNFNSKIDEIVKNYFKGYSVAVALEIANNNIADTTDDLSNQDKAEITYAALQRRKWARKRRPRDVKY